MNEQMIMAVKYCLHNDDNIVDKGIRRLQKLASSNSEAAYILAKILISKKNNYNDAFLYLKQSANENYSLAFQDLGALYQLGKGCKRDVNKAIEYYKKCGNPICHYSIGKIYHMGVGVDQNYKEASKWFKIAADNEYSDACGMLGVMYYNGEYFDENFTMALYWFEKCYDLGNKTIAMLIANMYNSDNDILSDDELAFEWYSKGSMDGIAECSYMLADIYKLGNSVVTKNEYKALELFKLAGSQGYIEGYIQAGLICLNGTTISHDYIKAEYLFNTALEKGHQNAIKALKYLELMKIKNGISVRKENNNAFSGTRLFDSGYTGLSADEYRYEQKERANNEQRKKMLYAASAVSSDTKYSYIDVDAGVIFDDNGKISSIIDQDAGIIISDNGVAFYDKDTNVAYSPEDGIVKYDSTMKMSYNYSNGKVVWHDGNYNYKLIK